ncbi:MAG: type IX secretion system protein PorQ [Cyclobacteriaceae bacterium]|nr:type IX secretion system protein PorQ [Cyclobacteriaceae bacterium]
MISGPSGVGIAKLSCILGLMLLVLPARAQFGGQKSFQFLNLPANARTAGLGAVNVSSGQGDVQMYLNNPALLDSTLDHHVALTYQSLVADINYGSFSYVRDLGDPGIWGWSVQFLDYGEFQGFDPSGAPTGTFTGSELAFTMGYARPLGPITMGANFKLLFSGIAGFNASLVALDIGGAYKHPQSDLTVGLTFKNIGFVLSDFTETSDSEMPFDVQIGITFKPQYMPFRFTLTGYNLSFLNEDLFDPTGTGEGTPQELSSLDRIFRHIAIGTEILIHKNFNVRAGYNHLIRQELRLAETSGGAGFSFGFLLKIKRFELAYSRGIYHTGGGYDYFTLASDLNSFIKRKN